MLTALYPARLQVDDRVGHQASASDSSEARKAPSMPRSKRPSLTA